MAKKNAATPLWLGAEDLFDPELSDNEIERMFFFCFVVIFPDFGATDVFNVVVGLESCKSLIITRPSTVEVSMKS